MDTQKHTHITPRIAREDFQAGYMKPGAYSLDDIAAAIIDNVTRPKEELTPRQLEGLRKFKYHGSWNLAQPESLANLHKFFDIFNDVYFNGVLTGHCKLEWFDSTARWGNRKVAWGICDEQLPRRVRDPRFKFEKPWAPIGIKKVDGRYNKAGLPYRIQRYLNCLAHEMLHAVFVVYACGCNDGCCWVTVMVDVTTKGRKELFDRIQGPPRTFSVPLTASAAPLRRAVEATSRSLGRALPHTSLL
ncbi:hypothetical protein F5882DRAFT_444091 [Hyaloscypha sp. PMI_1271]|nr:hypothetical protein F5882DRAFT_444091 [Hyaloscypha sp. PMI_1271]